MRDRLMFLFKHIKAIKGRFINITDRAMLGLLLIVALSTSGLSALVSANGADNEWWSGWLQNFSTEMMGAVVTFFLFTLILAERQRISQLTMDLGSHSNETALNAAYYFKTMGYLRNSRLTGSDLQETN